MIVPHPQQRLISNLIRRHLTWKKKQNSRMLIRRGIPHSLNTFPFLPTLPLPPFLLPFLLLSPLNASLPHVLHDNHNACNIPKVTNEHERLHLKVSNDVAASDRAYCNDATLVHPIRKTASADFSHFYASTFFYFLFIYSSIFWREGGLWWIEVWGEIWICMTLTYV